MQYVPFASDIEIPFYASLASHKINHDKLDDSARKVLGLYEIRPADSKEHSCRMQIHGNALTSDEVSSGYYRAEGLIKNVNTIEEYRNIDKIAMLHRAGRTVWDAINDGTIYSCPSLLSSFLILSYADLKKYRFSYWFAFPALVSDPPWAPVMQQQPASSLSRTNASESASVGTGTGTGTSTGGNESGSTAPTQEACRALDSLESMSLVNEVQTWRLSVDPRQYGFFLARKLRKGVSQTHTASTEVEAEGLSSTEASRAATAREGYIWQIASLSAYEAGFFEGEYADDCFVCFADPSNYTAETGQVAPGWMLRNLLVLVRQRWKRDRVQILCYRDTHVRRHAARSVVFDMAMSSKSSRRRGTASTVGSEIATGTGNDTDAEGRDPMPKVVGWERNAHGKLTGRSADLTEYMDPTKLADSAVDLNLKLMKWRIAPNLNLDKVKNTRCLLLGAGTLGSYVARNLMGWGVRKITFVDNAGVSFSNPVRQPLFTFQDCLGGGKRKAQRAAEALKEIYPGIDAEGHVMSVPMIGHPVTDEAKTKAEFEKLQRLIDEHDVVFLLMDTRESRWLPTVMAKAAGKIVMNAALGFDTYVVMRHGVKNEESNQTELGCYFCNDVVAPQDSMQDRTLDQQCTVTRPGVAAIASALLVEILISVLQHPHGGAAPASTASSEDRGEHPLGLVPHQIRGFLSNFTNINVVGRSYDCCSACSDKIVQAYRTDGWSFVEKALNEKDYVEEHSGLREVQRQAEAAAAAMEADFDDEDGLAEDEDGELI